MGQEPFDAQGFIRAILARGWRWSGDDPDVLVHPADHAFFLRYDRAADRLTVSPALDAYLGQVILTPASRGPFRR